MTSNRYQNDLITVDSFLNSEYDGVFYLGHASIIAKISGKNFLFDYVKDDFPYGDRWRFFPPLIQDIPLNRIDGIFVSHMHQDHFDSTFLTRDDIDCQIYVIGWRDSFEEVMDRHGIKRINIPAQKKFEIAPGVYVFGFMHQDNGVDASCCIGNLNFSVYHGNDNYLTNELLQGRDPEFFDIDVACIPYAYINWYPQLLENLSNEEKSCESKRLTELYFEYAIEQANQLNAKQVIPFGANLIYRDSARSPLNSECKTPLDFEYYVRGKMGKGQAQRVKAIFGGDSITKESGVLVIRSADLYDSETYRTQMQVFLDASNSPLESKTAIKLDELDFLPSIKIKTPTPYEHYVCVQLVGREIGVMINTADSSVAALNIEYLIKNCFDYHVINISNQDLFFKWVEGKIRMEEIIGSREFSIYRRPNTYDKHVLFIATTQL